MLLGVDICNLESCFTLHLEDQPAVSSLRLFRAAKTFPVHPHFELSLWKFLNHPKESWTSLEHLWALFGKKCYRKQWLFPTVYLPMTHLNKESSETLDQCFFLFNDSPDQQPESLLSHVLTDGPWPSPCSSCDLSLSTVAERVTSLFF